MYNNERVRFDQETKTISLVIIVWLDYSCEDIQLTSRRITVVSTLLHLGNYSWYLITKQITRL